MIRAAAPEDAPAVVDLAVASGLFPAEEVGLVDDLMRDFFARTRDEGHVCVVDEEGGEEGGEEVARLVGVAYYRPEDGTDGAWELLMIGVRRDLQGGGRGTALMRHVEDDLGGRGQRLLLVRTSGTPDFARTRDFYAGLGYGAEARVRDYYAAGDDLVLFRKELRQAPPA